MQHIVCVPYQPQTIMKLPKEYLTEEEIRSVIDATGRGVTGKRNKALLMLMYKGCLRISEALALKLKDVDSDSKTIRVLHGKGDKSRTVAVDGETIAVLQSWIDARKNYATNHKPLFCLISKGKEGEPMLKYRTKINTKGVEVTEADTSYVWAMIKRLGKKAGLEKRIHPHAFRYTGATHLRDRNAPLAVIKEQLGHANTSTTDIYLRDISPKEMIKGVQSAWGD